jgi:uncharacterized membrane protein
LLVGYGLRRRDSSGWLVAALGGAIALRGASGHSAIYQRFGVSPFDGDSTGASVHGTGIRVLRSITVGRPIHEVYSFWRRLENLPRFMRHLIRVSALAPRRYRWEAKAPFGTVRWDAEIIEDHAPGLIAWRSLPGSQIDNAGSVHFQKARAGRGTEILVSLAYKPPAGPVGALVARLLGEEPHVQVSEDLERFKRILETNPVPAGIRYGAGGRPRAVRTDRERAGDGEERSSVSSADSARASLVERSRDSSSTVSR